jgi:hypothetical protein
VGREIKMFEDLKKLVVGDEIACITPEGEERPPKKVECIHQDHVAGYAVTLTGGQWITEELLAKGWTFRKIEKQTQKPEIPDFLVPGAEIEYSPHHRDDWRRRRITSIHGDVVGFETGVKFKIEEVKWRKPQDTEEKPEHWPFMPVVGQEIEIKVNGPSWRRFTVSEIVGECLYDRDEDGWSFDGADWDNGFQFRKPQQQEEQAQQRKVKLLSNATMLASPVAPKRCKECGAESELTYETGSKLNNEGIGIKEFRLGLIRNGGRIGVGEGERP